ncbi:hypothetical protein FDP41_010749 [Naegleria fowleri]|uniref:Ferritin n=1 Tax=Naegleria fowleri TaxID=5763 RepID=A0A6A5CAT7_NAEFO|nr:uncharacterized protein FDP41_010749 [Naegleria fowleri]KAF0982770.1 hypothetical protein FDP41_010749 [Naegleria fowleri]CAG4712200.1 unnamed protein product [Naegleria fowleri]
MALARSKLVSKLISSSITHPVMLSTTFKTNTRSFSSSASKTLDNTSPHNKIRYNYSSECEQLVNEQINHELNASYFYTALGTYYSQPTVALPGVANYFLAQSNEERRHAHALIQYQNGRGGKVQFSAIQAPPDFSKVLTGGEASSAAAAPQNMKNSSCDTVGCTNNIATVTTRGFELAIETERMVYDKIRYIYQVAESQRDFALTGFLQKLIDEQVESLRELQELYTKSKRMVNEYWFDQYLVNSSVASSVESGATEFKSGSAQ